MAPFSTQNATSAISCAALNAHDGTPLCSWINNPGTRGTLNILWLCISTLGLCVWNAAHPDVPYPGTPWRRVTGRRIWWLFFGLFMPEMLVLAALSQFRQAYTLLVRVSRETHFPTKFPWWMRVIERLWPTPLTGHEIVPSRRAQRARKHPWTLTHSFFAVMHGFIAADGDLFSTTVVNSELAFIQTFDPDKGVRYLRTNAALGGAFSIPDISADELNDRSKADAAAKVLLVWQFSVFIANCAARWAQHLPLSLLEITTVAHSLCSLIALVLWWSKPHGINEATKIYPTYTLPAPPKEGWDDVANHVYETLLPSTNMDIPRTITILGIAVLYGLPHLLGVSVHFPSSFEQRYWRIATAVVIGSPVGMCLLAWIRELGFPKKLGRVQSAASFIQFLLFSVLIFLYPVASMFIVGVSMRQVFALPEGSFQEPQLTRYLPNFS